MPPKAMLDRSKRRNVFFDSNGPRVPAYVELRKKTKSGTCRTEGGQSWDLPFKMQVMDNNPLGCGSAKGGGTISDVKEQQMLKTGACLCSVYEWCLGCARPAASEPLARAASPHGWAPLGLSVACVSVAPCCRRRAGDVLLRR